MNLYSAVGTFVVVSLFLLFEIGVMMFVTNQIPILDNLGLVRYHSQRALNCYILILQENTTIFDTKIFANDVTNSKDCFDTSYNYINNQFPTSTHLFSKIWNGKRFESQLKDQIKLFLPDINELKKSIFTNFTEMHTFILTQSRAHANIVSDVTTLVRKKSNALVMFHIINYILMFVFAFLTFTYVYTSNRVKKRQHSIKVEKSVINQLCHELSTSLTPIEMYSRELIQNPTTNFEQKQFVNNYILSSLKQHKYILNSRLDFEKILSNEYELRLDNVDVISNLNAVIQEIKQYVILSNKAIEISLCSKMKSLYIQIDKLIFHYILTNVLRNSVKYSNSGTIKICVNCPYQQMTVEIYDESDGLTVDLAKKLSESTNKMSIVHTKEGDSYGLGIPFTKKLVSLLNQGTYSIRCTENGSCTRIAFNVKNADQEYIQSTRLSLTMAYNVCIVDDCPIVRNVMKRTFLSIFSNANIFEFSNGEQLLKHTFRHQQVYVHVIDQNMKSTGGKLKGHEVAAKLKAINYEQHRTISMSGNELDASERKYFDLLWNKPPPSNDVIKDQITKLTTTEIVVAI